MSEPASERAAQSYLRLERLDNRVGLIEIDRPDAHNALDHDAQLQFDELLAEADADPGIGAVVVAGAGEKALSAGWDIDELLAMDAETNARVMAEREEWLWRWYTCPTPTVAAMRGICYGAGALLAACADLRVGGPGTRFKVTGISYGYPNLTWLLPELLGSSRAKDVLLTGTITGEHAREVGLLTRFAPDQEIRDAAVALAAKVAGLPAGGVREAKRLIRDGVGRDARARYDAENDSVREALGTVSTDEVFAGFTQRERG